MPVRDNVVRTSSVRHSGRDDAPRGKRWDYGSVNSPAGDPSFIADAIRLYFLEHEVASLRLPSGWFGRPHDNWHRLAEVGSIDGELVVRLDEVQVLTVEPVRVSSEDRVLRVEIRAGRWTWTEYGGDREHVELLGPGNVEFHAPFQR